MALLNFVFHQTALEKCKRQNTDFWDSYLLCDFVDFFFFPFVSIMCSPSCVPSLYICFPLHSYCFSFLFSKLFF